MNKRPLHAETMPIFRLLVWLMLAGAVLMMFKWVGVVNADGTWFIGYFCACGLVFLECLRVETVNADKGD